MFLAILTLSTDNPSVRLVLLMVCLVSCEQRPQSEPRQNPIDAGWKDVFEAVLVEAPAKPLDSLFLGEDDTQWRAALRDQDVIRIEPGGSGRSLGFRITLADGRRGYFKPAQSFSGAHWYSEIAAHYLDRELGFGRAPPVVGRELYWPPLRNVASAAEDGRIPEVHVAPNGIVKGAFIGWIEGGLPSHRMGRFWERWVRIEGGMPFSPYQRTRDYRMLRSNQIDPSETEAGRTPEAVGEIAPERAAELSDMIVFDYLISNVDRWGGEFTNVRTRGRNGPLIFLDNGAGFWLGRNRLGLMDARLSALQRFRFETVDALERFELARFRERLEGDPLHPVLNEFQVTGVEERRQQVLQHVRAMRERFGERVFIDRREPPNARQTDSSTRQIELFL